MPTITLPTPDGLKPFTLSAPRDFPKATPPFPRLALAAAHVVADPLAEQDPWLDAEVDWDAPSPSGATSGRSASASPRRWTPRSAAWAWTGRRRRS